MCYSNTTDGKTRHTWLASHALFSFSVKQRFWNNATKISVNLNVTSISTCTRMPRVSRHWWSERSPTYRHISAIEIHCKCSAPTPCNRHLLSCELQPALSSVAHNFTSYIWLPKSRLEFYIRSSFSKCSPPNTKHSLKIWFFLHASSLHTRYTICVLV